LSKKDSIFSFEQVKQRPSKEWENGDIYPGRRFWGCTNTLSSEIKLRLKQKFRPKYALKVLFFRKNCKNCRSVGGFAPKPPLASSGWGSAPDSELLFSHIIVTSKS